MLGKTNEIWIVEHWKNGHTEGAKRFDYDPLCSVTLPPMSVMLSEWGKSVLNHNPHLGPITNWIKLYDNSARLGLVAYQAIADIVRDGHHSTSPVLRKLFFRLLWGIVGMWVALGLDKETVLNSKVN